jgi:hypothetical protein
MDDKPEASREQVASELWSRQASRPSRKRVVQATSTYSDIKTRRLLPSASIELSHVLYFN